jgi:hypothetical protein
VTALALLCAAGLLTFAVTSVAGATAPAAKKRCRVVTKKVRGKTKRVRVCAEAARAKPKPAPPTAALVVGATVEPDIAVVGEDVTYRVTVLNQGPKTAKSLSVAIESPIGLDSVRPDPRRGACDQPSAGPTAFRCRVPALAANAIWTLELVGKPTEPGSIRFAAAVRSATPDPSSRNGAIELVTPVGEQVPPGQAEPPPPPLDP